nr:heparan-alpha-glucosaminide N-acetyltransferase domain-containing protein [Burkholderia ubonensis]
MSAFSATAAPAASHRLIAIDALRGFVMLLMLIDHVRETFFLHQQVSDPMNALSVDPALFFTRLTSQLCAPAFVFLTGLSAWLYGQDRSPAATAAFLVKRGAFLIVLELTLVSFAWTAEFPPSTLWLQVIWAIGLSMVALAALLRLPRGAQFALGAVIVAGHNLLDGFRLGPDLAGFVPWSILHQRVFIDLWDGMRARTTYPVLPWIGVILLGYAAGPWYARGTNPRGLPAQQAHRSLCDGRLRARDRLERQRFGAGGRRRDGRRCGRAVAAAGERRAASSSLAATDPGTRRVAPAHFEWSTYARGRSFEGKGRRSQEYRTVGEEATARYAWKHAIKIP